VWQRLSQTPLAELGEKSNSSASRGSECTWPTCADTSLNPASGARLADQFGQSRSQEELFVIFPTRCRFIPVVRDSTSPPSLSSSSLLRPVFTHTGCIAKFDRCWQLDVIAHHFHLSTLLLTSSTKKSLSFSLSKSPDKESQTSSITRIDRPFCTLTNTHNFEISLTKTYKKYFDQNNASERTES